LRQRLEQARRHNHSVEQMQQTLGASIGQVDSILETFSALLRIAQIEAGQGSDAHTVFDLSATLARIVEDFSPAAEDRGQILTARLSQGLRINGDRGLIVQMVVNLLENAMRHSPTGAIVELIAESDDTAVTISVVDNGPGIQAAEREKVLRPFYRLESSRTTDGSGLGLSLVAAIAKRHSAPLALSDNNPGLRVTVQFPVPSAA
jgi:signal transduction histidine kinase